MFAMPASSDEGLMDAVASACAEDKEKYCAEVTPGNPDRMLACAYAHEDKLSGQCSYALYQAAAALEQATNALAYIADACMEDAQKLCAEVQLGEGRVLSCLTEAKEELGDTCTAAIEQTVGFE